MSKIRHRRLLAVQADLEMLFDAAERLERAGRISGQYEVEIARLEAREKDLQRRIRDGSDMQNAVASYQRAKTHCPKGHAYVAENLIVDKRGYRKCRTCKRRSDLIRWRRKNGR